MKTLQIVVCKDYVEVLFLDETPGVNQNSSMHQQFNSIDEMLQFFDKKDSELCLTKMELKAPRG